MKDHLDHYDKSRLDYAFNLVKGLNAKAEAHKRIDEGILYKLNRHLQTKGLLTNKQHLALEEFISKWQKA